MNDQELKTEIRNEVARALQEYNKQKSSTKISKSTTGKPSFEVKVYGEDPVANSNAARLLIRNLTIEFFPNEDVPEHVDYPPMQAYEKDAQGFVSKEDGAPTSFDGDTDEDSNLFD